MIRLQAREIILSQTLLGELSGGLDFGEALIIGEQVIISSDSQLGSNLKLSDNVVLDVSRLLETRCAERGASRSTFSRGGRGGLPAFAGPAAAVRWRDHRERISAKPLGFGGGCVHGRV